MTAAVGKGVICSLKKTAMTVGQNYINIWQKYRRQLAKKAATVGKGGSSIVDGASLSVPLLHHS